MRGRTGGLLLQPRCFLWTVDREALRLSSKLLSVPYARVESFTFSPIYDIVRSSNVHVELLKNTSIYNVISQNYSRYLYGYVQHLVIQGCDSISCPLHLQYCPSPSLHRHQPRLPAKPTHHHNTGFPPQRSRGSLWRRTFSLARAFWFAIGQECVNRCNKQERAHPVGSSRSLMLS